MSFDLSDAERFIHIVPDEAGDRVAANAVTTLPSTLDMLGLSVTTGKAVDFRAKHHPALRRSAVRSR